jgi:NADP-dependent 3-hydroxy acid dehydrogenase YdfG
MKILIAGNKNYGLSKSLYDIYPDATFLSRSTGQHDVRESVGPMSLDYDVFISVSCLSQFKQVLLVESVAKTWIENNHKGYLIAIGSSADTPVKASGWSYPAEKKALRAYMRQLSQVVSSDNPQNWKSTYVSPGNMHTPRQDEKMPNIPKLDTDYVANVIEWLINQPDDVNISELCLDKKQK